MILLSERRCFLPCGSLINSQVMSVTMICGEYLNYIEFNFNDGTTKRGGGNLEFLDYPCASPCVDLILS